MSTTRIKQKLSSIVQSQLPEFVQSDFNTFVLFLEAYYKFLEQDQGAQELLQNSKSYNDLDSTVESFVQYFVQTYAPNIPSELLVDQKLLIKKIKNLYEAKGSELSFKLLFRILFNSDMSVIYPYENVLRVSGGKWEQKFSLRLETVSGNRNAIIDRFLTFTVGGIVYKTPILSTKILTTTLLEVFLDPKLLAPSYTINQTATVFDENDNAIFVGTIRPTTTSFTIFRRGLGFKVGQIYTITFGGAVDTLLKITEVNSSGGILNAKIINFGYNFSTAFSVELDPNKSVSELADFLTSTTGGFGSSGSILSFDPLSPDAYFAEDYNSDVTFYTFTSAVLFNDDVVVSPIDTVGKPENFATLSFSTGSLAAYPGSYISNESFISEEVVRLQDDQLYQPFAYQTVTEIDISKFFDAVKQLLHPAGQKLFNNRIIEETIDLSTNVEVVTQSNVSFESSSVAVIADETSLNITIPVPDVDLILTLSDTLVATAKILNSDTTLAEDGNLFIQDYFAENYVQFGDSGYIEGTTTSIF